MGEHYLATYLNDHLAGSTAGLELLEHLFQVEAGTPVAHFAAGLHAEIAADRRELEALMTRWGVPMSRPRRAAAWLAEKLTALKLRLDDPAAGPLHLLEVCEGVSVGVEGKRLLWRALAAAAEGSPALAGTDYQRLEQRAEEQRQALETVRLEAARRALRLAPSRSGE
ncbi:MAG: hypothetical protein JO112_13775 [Planctomycetes bacterium]|nr:hypothetical protein [Planctomycetota bacterium]